MPTASPAPSTALPVLETELGANSRAIVLGQFGIEAIADRYEALYEQLVRGRRKQP